MKSSNRYAKAYKASRNGAKAEFSEVWDAAYERQAQVLIKDIEKLIKKCEDKRHAIFDVEVRTLPHVLNDVKRAVAEKNAALYEQSLNLYHKADDIRRSFSRNGAKAKMGAEWNSWAAEAGKHDLANAEELLRKCQKKRDEMTAAVAKLANVIAKIKRALQDADEEALDAATADLSKFDHLRFSRNGAKAKFSETKVMHWVEEHGDDINDILDMLNGPVRLQIDPDTANPRRIHEALKWVNEAAKDVGQNPNWLQRANRLASQFSRTGEKSTNAADSLRALAVKLGYAPDAVTVENGRGTVKFAKQDGSAGRLAFSLRKPLAGVVNADRISVTDDTVNIDFGEKGA